MYKIKIKSITVVRYSTAQMLNVKIWIDKYRTIFKKLNIIDKKKHTQFRWNNISNKMYKKSWCTGVFKRQKFYAVNFENAFFFIIFECIIAINDYPLFPIIIIQNQNVMDNWFAKKLFEKTLIILSKKLIHFG